MVPFPAAKSLHLPSGKRHISDSQPKYQSFLEHLKNLVYSIVFREPSWPENSLILTFVLGFGRVPKTFYREFFPKKFLFETRPVLCVEGSALSHP